MSPTSTERRLPIGAEVTAEGVHFRVWAPDHDEVLVHLEPEDGAVGAEHELTPERGGYFSGLVQNAGSGARYGFRPGGADRVLPDPASRFQPDGPHGPSQVVDPSAYRWSDAEWAGRGLRGSVIYELHIGTFTPEGTWEAAARRLPRLADLGVNVLEIMPVAEFPGRFGWGYDGVDLFAPTRLYGRPDDLRRFVDEAHRLRLAVLLDVVYNHIGPDGNYLPAYSSRYFTDRYETPWGAAIDFDGEDSGPVREFFIANAGYWIDEYHVDGLRLDAVHAIIDRSEEHVVTALARHARRKAGDRRVLITIENEDQEAGFARRSAHGDAAVDALWNDDFHHAAKVALAGAGDAYYTGFTGSPQELVSAARHGFLFQGQPSPALGHRRGTPARDLNPERFIVYLDNHDQIANAGAGRRAHMLSDPSSLRAMTALLLLAPGTPLLFQGQEHGASSPFHFFADHNPDLAPLVREGRTEFMSQFPGPGTPEGREVLPAPDDEAAYLACRLNPEEADEDSELLRLHRDLLRMRREDAVISGQGRVDGAVLAERAFVLRFDSTDPETSLVTDARLLVVNLDRTRSLEGVAEPLLAPPEGTAWHTLWSSEHPDYGGLGTPGLEREEGWWLPGRTAELLAPRPPA